MKKYVVILCLIFGLVFLIGCTGVPGQNQQVPANNFRVGTEGLRMTVSPNTPPPRLFDFQDMNLLVQIQNAGAHDIPGDELDRVYLSGFDNTIIAGINPQGEPIPQLEGRSFFGQGTTDVVTFNGKIQSGRLANPYPVRMLVTSCYRYETIAEGPVCIDPDPFTTSSVPKACIPQPVSLGSQGAPISVQRIDLDPGSQRTRLAFRIINNPGIGGGEPFRPGAAELQKCSPYAPEGLDFDEINHVQVLDVVINGVSILSTCKPLIDGQYLRLDRGQGTLFCDFNQIGGAAAFTTPAQISLRYGYRQNVFRDVTIVPDQ